MKHLKTYESFDYSLHSLNEEEEIFNWLKNIGSKIYNFFASIFKRLFSFDASKYKAKSEEVIKKAQETPQWKSAVEKAASKTTREQADAIEASMKRPDPLSKTQVESLGDAAVAVAEAQKGVQEVTERLKSGTINESRGHNLLREALESQKEAEDKLKSEVKKTVKQWELPEVAFVTMIPSFFLIVIGLTSGSFITAVIGAGVIVAGLLAVFFMAVAIVVKAVKKGEDLPRGFGN